MIDVDVSDLLKSSFACDDDRQSRLTDSLLACTRGQ